MSKLIVCKEFAPDPDYPKITLEATYEAIAKIEEIAVCDPEVLGQWEHLVKVAYNIRLEEAKSENPNPSLSERWAMFEAVSELVATNMFAIFFC